MPPTLTDAFLTQAQQCDDLGSPFTARLCRLLAMLMVPGTALADRLLQWPGDPTHNGANLPLRVTGALHAIVLSGRDPDLVAAYPPAVVDDAALRDCVAVAIDRNQDFINAFIDSPPQTNEVARSAALICAGHWLADRFRLPMVISELGASAGLNLNWDRYALYLGADRFGPQDAVLDLVPEQRGESPPHAQPEVVARRGVDLRPTDLTDAAQLLRLRAYIWPDQTARMDRMRRATTLTPAAIDAGDAADWLQMRLRTTYPGCLHLVYHTIAWTYFPKETQASCRAALDAAGARATMDAPLAHLAMEADTASPGAGLSLEIWPGRQSYSLGRVDFHGRWLDWKPRQLS